MAANKKVNIQIKTIADLSAARKAREALKAQIAEVKKQGGSTKELDAKLKKLNKTITEGAKKQKALAREAKKTGKALKNQGKAAKEAGAGVGSMAAQVPLLGRAMALLTNPILLAVAALAALGKGLTSMIGKFAEAEVSLAKLDAALAANGLFTDGNREKYIKLSEEMQNLTAVGDNVWQDVFAALTQFGATPENIGKISMATAQLASVMGGGDAGLKTATQLMSKVIAGYTTGLSRYGIIVDTTKTKTEQQQEIFEKLARVGGGQLEAMSTTLIGQWGQLKNVAGDLMESFGRLLDKTTGLRKGLENTVEIFAFWAEAMDTARDKTQGVTNAQADALATQKQISEATAAHAEAMEDLAGSTATATAAQRELQQILSEELSLEQQLIEKKKALALAQIRNDDSLSDTERARMELVVTERARRATVGARGRASQAQQQIAEERIVERQSGISERETEVADLEKKLDAANQAADAKTNLQEIARKLEATIEEASGSRGDDLKEILLDIISPAGIGKEFGEISALIDGAKTPGEIREAARDYIKVLQQAQELAIKDFEEANAKTKEVGKIENRAETELEIKSKNEQLESERKAATTEIKKLQDEINDLKRARENAARVETFDRRIAGEGLRENVEESGAVGNRSLVGREDMRGLPSSIATSPEAQGLLRESAAATPDMTGRETSLSPGVGTNQTVRRIEATQQREQETVERAAEVIAEQLEETAGSVEGSMRNITGSVEALRQRISNLEAQTGNMR